LTSALGSASHVSVVAVRIAANAANFAGAEKLTLRFMAILSAMD